LEPFVRELFIRPTSSCLSDFVAKRCVPECEDAVAKRADSRPVCWDGMIREKARDDLSQLVSLFGLVDVAPLQRFFDFLEFRAHAVASGFPLEEEPARRDFPQIS